MLAGDADICVNEPDDVRRTRPRFSSALTCACARVCVSTVHHETHTTGAYQIVGELPPQTLHPCEQPPAIIQTRMHTPSESSAAIQSSTLLLPILASSAHASSKYLVASSSEVFNSLRTALCDLTSSSNSAGTGTRSAWPRPLEGEYDPACSGKRPAPPPWMGLEIRDLSRATAIARPREQHVSPHCRHRQLALTTIHKRLVASCGLLQRSTCLARQR